jgi:dienelactone hydrolase
MRLLALLPLFFAANSAVLSQEAVHFFSADSVKIRGDLYLKDSNLPFIILCPPDGSNHSDFSDIAPRLMNLNYNCLAIDIRSGGNPGYGQHETAVTQSHFNYKSGALDALDDIRAAIRYTRNFNSKPVVLLGSCNSASLCLLESVDDPLVKAVVALSPGEYFEPFKTVSQETAQLTAPVFVSATGKDFPYLQKMFSAAPAGKVTLFKPEKSQGTQGTGALSPANPGSSEYWFALLMFFKNLN